MKNSQHLTEVILSFFTWESSLHFYLSCVVVFGALCTLTHDASGGVCVTQISQFSHQKQLGDVLDLLIPDVTLSRKLFSKVRNISKVSVP